MPYTWEQCYSVVRKAYRNLGNLKEKEKEALYWFLHNPVEIVNPKWKANDEFQEYASTVTPHDIGYALFVMWCRHERREKRPNQDLIF